MKRLSSGITGLDKLIGGGFPENTASLISGPAGSGKTIFCLHFLLEGAKQGERGLYISLEESREELERAMEGFTLDLKKMKEQGMIRFIDLGEMRRDLDLERRKKMVAFNTLSSTLSRMIEETKATRLVVDSLSAAGLPYRSSEELREDLFCFVRDLKDQKVSSLLISESLENGALTRYNIEQFVADTFIVLGLEEIKGDLRRTLTVRKMRFTNHDTAKHPFLIRKSGIHVAADEKVF
ncbi:MAG: ATPase domain-containing protein [Candidatus Thermoplasmatota archaeon]|nr:ATPase domain-containing protein [Candidatus Thermoplasmatota archaeon]